MARTIDKGDYLTECLGNVIQVSEDWHSRAMAMWPNGNHEQAVKVVSEPERLATSEKIASFPVSSGLPTAVFALGHVLAMSGRPPVKGLDSTVGHVQN